ncbi:MAG: 3-oxoacid CoA-transferase subunit A [Chloroflexota bacterium]|jgi:acetate CoA/acetoacetate CoA-transferase alpha subunit|nr:3-oxoacid CoA-transferase subunit A [Chloroflexota bacterium]MDP6507482.1 3-oxoacid CoA-transferase subunit A [Chloroflexota bacterium]MDP6757962.1 3-oxoacid CoA-transferase subunit A [Chloroflexota bacterium]
MSEITARPLDPVAAGVGPTDKETTIAAAIARIAPGSTVMIGGFMDIGAPHALLDELAGSSAGDLHVIANDTATPRTALGRLLISGLVTRLTVCYAGGNRAVQELARSGGLELEFIPLGTLVERIRAAGAGLGGFLTPTGLGTPMAEGKPTYDFNGQTYLVEEPLRADVALLGAFRGDRHGNLTYRGTARNINPVMATAAGLVIAEVEQLFDAGDLDPGQVGTPSVFIDLVTERPG